MPLYDYECSDCGDVFELKQSFSAEPRAECPSCQGESRRKFHPVPIIYKGTGFYTTDFKHSGYSAAEKLEKGDTTDKPKSSESSSEGAKDSTAAKESTASKESPAAKDSSSSSGEKSLAAKES